MKRSTFCILTNILLLVTVVTCKKAAPENKPEWAKKDIRDYSDADLERLLDQWEVSNQHLLKHLTLMTYGFRKMKTLLSLMSFPNISDHSHRLTCQK
jgi:hypothetical protein